MINTYPSNALYILLVTFSTLIIISSNNWFLCWIGLEMSLFGFLPLFLVTPLSSEGIINYFLIQASGSVTFLASVLTTLSYNPTLLILSISINLGIFPFIQWIPLVITALSWSGCLILSTLQNLGPLVIIILSTEVNSNIALGAISLIISSILGFNQTNFRTLLSYSAIIHSAWLCLATLISENITFSYILLYFFLTTLLFLSIHLTETDNTNNINTNTSQDQIFILLVLAGIPPFSIFILNISIFIWFFNQPLLLIVIILSTAVSIYFYLTIALPIIINTSNNASLIALLNLLPLGIFFIYGGNTSAVNPFASSNNFFTLPNVGFFLNK